MKNIIFALSLLLFVSCQMQSSSNRYAVESDEINICQTSLKAYAQHDWDTYREVYADSAKLYYNVYFAEETGESVNEYIKGCDTNLAFMVGYEVEEHLWEMIVDEDGEKWIYMWGRWVGNLAENKTKIETPMHIVYHVKDGLIVEEAGFWDNLPFYLALQEE